MKVLDAGRSLLQISAVNVSTGCCGCVSDCTDAYYEMVTRSSYDQDCVSCAFFPVCMGGCRRDSLKAHGTQFKKNCNLEYYTGVVMPDLTLYFDQMSQFKGM